MSATLNLNTDLLANPCAGTLLVIRETRLKKQILYKENSLFPIPHFFFSLKSHLLFYSPSAVKCAPSSSSSSSLILLQGTVHPISSSLVKHTQCAALIPFYNQDTWQCYGDVTFLMHRLRWLAWNASSQGYVVSCRHTGLIHLKKKKTFSCTLSIGTS